MDDRTKLRNKLAKSDLKGASSILDLHPDLLSEMLNDELDSVRCSAAYLGSISSSDEIRERSLEVLMELLIGNAALSANAASYISNFGKLAIGRLLSILESGNSHAMILSANSICNICSKEPVPEALEVLVNNMEHPNEQVRMAVAESVSKIAHVQSIKEFSKKILSLAKSPHYTCGFLCSWHYCNILSKLGQEVPLYPAIPLLRKFLISANPDLSKKAAYALRSASATTDLSKLLNVFIDLLNRRNNDIQFEISVILVKIGAAAVPKLCDLLEDEETHASAKRWAIHSLGQILSEGTIDQRAISLIKSQVKLENIVLSKVSVEAIGKLYELMDFSDCVPALVHLLKRGLSRDTEEVVELLLKLYKTTEPNFFICELLQGVADENSRHFSAKVLVESGDPRFIYFGKLLNNPSPADVNSAGFERTSEVFSEYLSMISDRVGKDVLEKEKNRLSKIYFKIIAALSSTSRRVNMKGELLSGSFKTEKPEGLYRSRRLFNG